MSVNWRNLYVKYAMPEWYRVETIRGNRYLQMVDMDGTLVSMPFFSYSHLTKTIPERVSEKFWFTLNGERLTCSEPSVCWQVRMFRRVSEHAGSHKVVSWLPLKNTASLQLAALPPNVRRKIRKAEKNGVEVLVGGPELYRAFFDIYAQNMHRLGAPTMSKQFYKGAVEAFGANGRFLIATYKGQAIGAAVWLQHQGKAEACWFATLDEYNALYTSYKLWWECIALACETGCSIFSFGRSTGGSGTHRYKSQWGTRNATLYWNYSHPVVKPVFRAGVLTFAMPSRDVLAKIWKYLPCFIVRWLGPLVAGKFY